MHGAARERARTGRALGWTVLVLGAVIVLRSSAGGDLAAPPLTSFDALGDWADQRDSATMAIALVRFVAELAGWYLLGLSVLYGLAHVLRWRGLSSLADALAAPGAARLVQSGLGVGLLATTAAGAAAPDDAGAAARPTTAVMQPVDEDEPGTAWMVPESDAPTTTVVAEEADAVAPPPAEHEVSPSTWTVSEGESLWSIAEDVLAATLGRTPTDDEIDPFWRALIDGNRDRLADPDDPDLILPGQVFEIPAPVVGS